MSELTEAQALIERYRASYITVFGDPSLVLDHGDGAYVWDVEGTRYLDLLGGIAVNALGHAHPALVEAIRNQAGRLLHISNFFTTTAQIGAAEAILARADAPPGSGVFFGNSGSEAIEAALKVARRTGRPGIVAVEGAFHGRTTGALALTWKEAYRTPFEPLLGGVSHVPFGDLDALRAAVTDDTGAILVEPILGEAGVIPAPDGYLAGVREIADDSGALMILDEIQTGVGRTGTWFAWQQLLPKGVRPDLMTLAKGLGGGVPIGALVAFGPEIAGLLGPGQHGSTFGGNPLACRAALTVLDTIERDDLMGRAVELGDHLAEEVLALGHPLITGVRGLGLLRAITLAEPIAPAVVAAARDAGFIINAPAPDALRLAPPLVVTAEELSTFTAALPAILDAATTKEAS